MILYNTFTDSWLSNLEDLITNGEYSSPRGYETLEIENRSIAFLMKNPILSVKKRNLGTAFLCAEPWWILSGDNRLSTIKPYAPMMERFSDEGIFLSGSYGPKVVDQLPYVVDCLVRDKFSRQAIMNIWREKPRETKDCPCTVTYQFRIRDDRLNMSIFMRSNDIWLGTTYDVFTQTMIAYAVCLLLRKEYPDLVLGNLCLFVGSLHIYKPQFQLASEIIEDDDDNVRDLVYDYSLSFEDLKEYLHECAKKLLNGLPVDCCFLKGLQPKDSEKGILI